VSLSRRPATIKRMLAVELARPRDPTGPAFAAVERELMQTLDGDQPRQASRDRGSESRNLPG
jgi:ABC-type nitrate/sulfonate/bicarbonate transport system ATPase subunit